MTRLVIKIRVIRTITEAIKVTLRKRFPELMVTGFASVTGADSLTFGGEDGTEVSGLAVSTVGGIAFSVPICRETV